MKSPTVERRKEFRRESAISAIPVSCVVHSAGKVVNASVVNYHYQGACLQANDISLHEINSNSPTNYVDFYFGKKCIKKQIPFRVCWKEPNEKRTIGIEFLEGLSEHIHRAERYLANPNYLPTVEATDPTDPHRTIFFRVRDLSKTGLLLETSLSNRHLFPGMYLNNATLMVPSFDPIKLDLAIENARRSTRKDTFVIGVTASSNRNQYVDILKKYLSHLTPMSSAGNFDFSQLKKSGLLEKKIKSAITYVVCESDELYDSVLKLRFKSFRSHGKICEGATWKEMGTGRGSEGTIICGFLGRRLVCSMELRFGLNNSSFRLADHCTISELPKIDPERSVEINRLVVDPACQGTDLVLGLIQRAHALVVNYGGIDVILSATDDLTKLYSSIGAEPLGVRYKHPVLDGVMLNAMIVRREVYQDGMGINPYAWNLIYKATHDHFFNLGVLKSYPKGLKRSVHSYISKQISSRRRPTSKKKGKSKRPQADPVQNNSGFISPKWTRQEVVATVMLPYILEACDEIGKNKVENILDGIGVPFEYFFKQSNWLSIKFHDEFLDQFAAYGNIAKLCRRAGQRSMRKDVAGVNYYLLKHFVTPKIAFQSFAKITSKFNRARTYQVKRLQNRSVIVSVGEREGFALPKHRESCENWKASFEAYIQLMTNRPGSVKKTSCSYDGDPNCSYEIRWQDSLSWSQTVAIGTIAVAASALSWFSLQSSLELEHAISLFVGLHLFFAMGILGLRYRSSKRSQRTAEIEFQQFQSETSEKYAELQRALTKLDARYAEAKILETLARDIQKSENANQILRTSLDSVIDQFGFDRCFAMLKSESSTLLTTAAISGVDTTTDLLWKFQVDIADRRENRMVLSSVFHTGSSILVSDVDNHLFQLNAESQRLIQTLESKGFVICPIPSEDGNWGVLVADKVAGNKSLDRRDVTLLERIGQQIGLALDKQDKIRVETQRRVIFQKYVPANIVDMTSTMQAPLLGGVTKEIGCAFIDIRGFTKLTEKLPPATTISIVNRFFNVANEAITKFDGYIDKYLGDGMMITWGAVGSIEVDAPKMKACLIEIFRLLPRLNAEYQQDGLPAISIGIGAHLGPALVGNVGSEHRMEHTCIGSTINATARIEALCKELDSPIVVSSEFAIRAQIQNDPLFALKKNVRIRGLKDPINVHYYNETKTKQKLRQAG